MIQQEAFDQFLREKGIDPQLFAAAENQRYLQIQTNYWAAGPIATDYAKKFQWNELRLEYPWVATLEKE